MTLSEELEWRGFKNQTTFSDSQQLDEQKRTFYWGVDPSAASMTIGNLAAGMMARCFMQHGYEAILLVGGATGMIGDPDGKKQERNLLTLEDIRHNKESIAKQYSTIFSGMDFKLVDNYDWFKDINYLEFLRDIGKHVSMTQMLDREFVQSRIGEGGAGISYAEFSYSLIQGYDFLHLFKEHGATLQLSGADQWGNSISGVNLISRIEGGEAHVWTAPLVVNKGTGVKFGKSEAGAVWLDPGLTSVFDFYQFWLNADDLGVGDYIKIYTLIQPKEFENLINEFEQNPRDRAAQKYLAYEVTKIVHGQKNAEAAKNATDSLYSGNQPSEDGFKLLQQQLPASSEANLADFLVATELASSKSEARRFIEAGAVSINGQKATEVSEIESKYSIIKRGKNKFALFA